jgi:hypothetical protein
MISYEVSIPVSSANGGQRKSRLCSSWLCSSWISFNQPGDPPRIDRGHNSQLKMRAGGISPLPLSV